VTPVRLSRQAGLDVFATASSQDARYVQGLGATAVLDYKTARFEEVDVVLDMVGGDTRGCSFRVLKPGGILVSTVSPPTPKE
jgi:NADPH:quinone reductase-like Zn-dependent oxidoreductase